MAANKPVFPASNKPPHSQEGRLQASQERELGRVLTDVRKIKDGRIAGAFALPSVPTGGTFAQGDVVRNSNPSLTLSGTDQYFIHGWEYVSEGSGTLTWMPIKIWSVESGGIASATLTATNVGTGTGAYIGESGGILQFRTLKSGVNATLSVSGNEIVIGGPPGLTTPRIPYVTTGGVIADSANLNWDNTNGRVGIGTATPTFKFQIYSAAAASTVTASAGNFPRIELSYAGTGDTGLNSAASYRLSTVLDSLNSAGYMGGFSMHNANYNGGSDFGAFRANTVVLQSAASNGMLITTQQASQPITLATNSVGDPTTAARRLTAADTGVCVGAHVTADDLLHVKGAISGRVATKIENTSNNFAANASVQLYNDVGQTAVFLAGSSGSSAISKNAAYVGGKFAEGVGIAAEHTSGVVKIYTGGATSSEQRAVVNATGMLGVGETNPQRRVHASVAAGADCFRAEVTTNGAADFAGYGLFTNGAINGAFRSLASGFTTSGLDVANSSQVTGRVAGGLYLVATNASGDVVVGAGGTAAANERAHFFANGDVRMGSSSITVSSSVGFVHIPSVAGAPVAVPVTYTGFVPMCYDRTNNHFYIYNGGWKKTTVFA